MVTVCSVHLRLNSFAMSTKMVVSPRAGPGVEALMKRFSSRIEFKPAFREATRLGNFPGKIIRVPHKCSLEVDEG